MSYWFLIFTLMVIGMCDAFGQFFWRNSLPGSLDESTSLDILHPTSRTKRFDDRQNIANSFYKGSGTFKNSGSTRRNNRNKRRLSGTVPSVLTNRLLNNDGAMQSTRNRRSNSNRPISGVEQAGKVCSDNIDSATSESNARRFYWEPIFDGGIIGAIGRLFSDGTKDEADRERIEREEIRNEKLIKKYTEMLNDPEQYKKLQEESAKSPTYINQMI